LNERIHIGKCPLDPGTLDQLVQALTDAVERREKRTVTGINAIMYIMTQRDEAYLNLVRQADCVISDGYWLAFAARWFGHKDIHHIAIVPLVFALLDRLRTRRRRVFLLGTKEELVQKAAAAVAARYPGITVAGYQNGYFTPEDEPAIARRINESQADVVLVGMTSPKKEEWMIRNQPRIGAPVLIGVGGLMDIWAGVTAEGPMWLRQIGMMWLYRLIQEPRRMWRRYLIGNPTFVWLICKEWWKSTRPASVDAGKPEML